VSIDALASLYGGKVARQRRALAGNIGGQERTQEVRTPPEILAAASEAMNGIRHDPCAASDPAVWFAERNETLPPEAQTLVEQLAAAESKSDKKRLKSLLKPYYLALPDSVEDGTFLNPPFDFLAPWMSLAAHEGLEGKRVVLLAPVRTHRRWFTRYAAGASGVWLAPLPFVGQKQAFPAPLCLLARNCVIPPLGRLETGRFVL
jgi:hypothetical protein